jgi:hypothetical protein
MDQLQVKIGPSFFKKAFNDYSEWRWAFAREAAQNSIDAPHSTELFVDIKRDGEDTLVIWSNNGAPMSRDELCNKFMALGESGKEFQGTVGGFGKAKEILAFCHKRYEIYTGNYHVVGSGGDYTLEECDHYKGTMTKVWIAGDEVYNIEQMFKTFVYMSQWKGRYEINGKVLVGEFRKGSRRRNFSWGTIYTNKSISNRLIVRIHGIPMFYRHLECNGRCVVVELTSGDASVLQSNRDNLSWRYQSELNSFIDDITVDKQSAFRDTSPRYHHFSGEKLRMQATKYSIAAIIDEAYATVPVAVAVEEEVSVAPAGVATVDQRTLTTAALTSAVAVHEEASQDEVRKMNKSSRISCEFVVKNTTGMEVPTFYMPYAFSGYSTKVASCWAKCLLAIHELFNKPVEFAIGFIFDDEREAEHEVGDYGTVYYVNPITIVKQNNSNSRSMSKRWKLTSAGRFAILAAAVHEFVHHTGYGPHDEGYANMLTSMMGVVLANIKRFHRCFR